MQRKELIGQLAKAAAACATAKTLAITFLCHSTEKAMKQAEDEFTALGKKVEAGSMEAVFTPEEAKDLADRLVDALHARSPQSERDVVAAILLKVTETKDGRYVHMGRPG